VTRVLKVSFALETRATGAGLRKRAEYLSGMKIVAFWASLLACCALVCCSTAFASASTVRIPSGQGASTQLAPEGSVLLQATVIPRDWCGVLLSHPRARSAASSPARATGGLAEFSWTVPRTVAPGAWRTVVRCATSRSKLARNQGSSAFVTLRTTHQLGRHKGSAAGRITVLFPHASRVPVSGKGGGAFQPYGTLLIAGSAWLGGQGVNVYSNGLTSGNGNGAYQCVELVNRLITTRGWSPSIYGNGVDFWANARTTYFDKHPDNSGYQPVPGDIVVWSGHTWGHVAVVNVNSGGALQVVEQNASANGYGSYPINSSGDVAPGGGYSVEGFLHPKADQASSGGGGGPGPTTSPAITTTSLPQGDLNQTYSAGLAASGGAGGYRWTVIGGTLPSGLLLSAAGTISGTPNASGQSTFTVKVTDSAGATAQATLSISIGPPGYHYVFYRGSDGAMHLMLWNGAQWADQTIGGSVAANTNPSAFSGANGYFYVFFHGSDGAIHLLLWNTSQWADQTLGGSVGVGSSPSAYQSSNGYDYVYYRGADGAMHLMLWNGAQWADQTIGGSVAAGTSPSAYTQSNGDHYVYFQGGDGAVHILLWNGTQWLDQTLGGHFATGASPSAYAASNGYFYVYYPGSDGAMHLMLWNTAQWGDQTIGGSVAAGTSPSAFTQSNGDHYVFFQASDGSAHVLLWNGAQWLDQTLGGHFATGASPSAYAGSNGYFYDYYPGSDGAIHLMLWNTAQWQDQTIGGTVAAGSSPSTF
jgi:hypothetical protein